MKFFAPSLAGALVLVTIVITPRTQFINAEGLWFIRSNKPVHAQENQYEVKDAQNDIIPQAHDILHASIAGSSDLPTTTLDVSNTPATPPPGYEPTLATMINTPKAPDEPYFRYAVMDAVREKVGRFTDAAKAAIAPNTEDEIFLNEGLDEGATVPLGNKETVIEDEDKKKGHILTRRGDAVPNHDNDNAEKDAHSHHRFMNWFASMLSASGTSLEEVDVEATTQDSKVSTKPGNDGPDHVQVSDIKPNENPSHGDGHIVRILRIFFDKVKRVIPIDLGGEEEAEAEDDTDNSLTHPAHILKDQEE
ncbi:hypothetical protein BC939DRAFT_203968 [Gamsiella multidivaricata]|uniref:uncharacterized protein n=1 Tax=Gamsiella multidivaricata TaxID=101098 RepID=UPI0022200D46|nr:uncharacterized protein BC939DRAFT_203968 [Gamsiella multidivaricata]KAG0350744.1 hypothetical protein BGZ54_003661 [Gamsiella multidivaricata]KAI7821504.1 hypothetical protein BC939DRAFT_203968 [Gamsiella multidivaricata]